MQESRICTKNEKENIKGLLLSKEYYKAHGASMLQNNFKEYANRIAVGLVGEGSECFGFDDEISRDHDWGPAFCMWLTDEDYDAIACELQEMYLKLPENFLGYRRRQETAGGAGRTGVLRISDFYQRHIGMKNAPENLKEWERLAESTLAVVTNGEVFKDELGLFSSIRNQLQSYYPEDVRIKKLVIRASTVAQSGQYNFKRCILRGESVAASLALSEFTQSACSMIYLLNRQYMPFYKWAHRGMKDMKILPTAYDKLNKLYAQQDPLKQEALIEEICRDIIAELREQGLTKQYSDFILHHCQDMVGRIQDTSIRTKTIMD